MIKNYFIIAWRNLSRNKTFSIIKILGLSIGLMVCMLIFLYTKDEVSYDRFHENKALLYRVIQKFDIDKQPEQTLGTTNAILGETFAKEIPGVQQYIHVNGAEITVKKENNDVLTEQSLFVDNNFLSLFTFPLLKGSASSALDDSHSVVLSRDMAMKYFGTTDIIGKTMQLKYGDNFDGFTVKAIAENPPQNSTLKFGILMPFKYFENFNSNKDWFGGSMNTFLLLDPKADIKIIEHSMQSLYDKHTGDALAKMRQEKGMSIKVLLSLQPLTAIHLSTEAGPDNGMTDGSKPVYSYILTSIAIFILIIACINFVNLAVAQSLKRSKEIGIRKVIGGSRKQLIKQFLTEAFLITLIAFTIGVALASLALPWFNQLANKQLSFAYLADNYLYAGLFLLLLITAFISGFYPSLVMSAFQPVKVLYNKQKLSGKNYLTKTLIVLQFGLAIFFIIGTIAINTQMNFLLKADLGYDSRNLVRITIPVSKLSDNLPGLFRNALAGNNNIVSVAAKNGGSSIAGVKVEGRTITIEKSRIDEQFLPTFKIPVIAGRNFSANYPTDSVHSVIVNESFVKEAGWTAQAAVGKTINYLRDNKPAIIIGVIKDYHFISLKEKITPELFTMDPNFNYGQIWVKIKPGNIPETLKLLQDTYKKVVPYFPYSYQFMDDINAKNYETEAKWKQIISIASGLFVFISCIGLFGLVILSIGQRTKEIGIRKVLGAAVSRIVTLICREFVALICISFVIAAPVGYYAINKWLQGFAYRINISWWMFALSGALVITMALLVMSVQTIKAAITNPVKSLRSE